MVPQPPARQGNFARNSVNFAKISPSRCYPRTYFDRNFEKIQSQIYIFEKIYKLDFSVFSVEIRWFLGEKHIWSREN